jgi:molybdopterin/thiamine biosynthesis adenylyltransferase/proteasome lid subunit RPN8/RPN11
MTTRIAFTEAQFAPLVAALGDGVETAAIVTASVAGGAASTGEVAWSGANVTLHAHDMALVAEGSYLERGSDRLAISSTGWVPGFRAAVANSEVPVFVHTHPGGVAKFSIFDDQVDRDLALAAHAFGAPYYAAVVVAGTPHAPEVAARLYDLGDGFVASGPVHVAIDAVRVAGSSLHLYLPPLEHDGNDGADGADGADETHASDETEVSVFDRQVRMLGTDGDRTLKQVRACIIGTGGTGSAVGVQLARLGLDEIVLIDDDVVTGPTPTRGHGMTTADVGRNKVEVLGDHLDAIGLGTNITTVAKALNDPAAIAAIAHADVIFCCVDGHGARLILNRWAYAHVAAVIDVAVLVTPANTGGNDTVQIEQRVTWIAPGTACLLCRGRIDSTLAYAELLDPETRKRLAGEGYVAQVETPQPAVVTLTTSVAALGTTEFLLRLTGLGPVDATEVLLRSHLGELRRNARHPRPGCFCADQAFVGRGTRAPYLDMVGPWT